MPCWSDTAGLCQSGECNGKSPVPVELQQNKIRVNGKVMDHNNDPLPGVNIKIKGTELGVVTDWMATTLLRFLIKKQS